MLLRVEPHGLFSWLFLDSSHLLPFSLPIPLFLLSPTSSTSSSAQLSLIRSGINSSTTSLRNSWVMHGVLNERQWRLYVATEAKRRGTGGISQVAREAGVTPKTIRKGPQELERGEP